MAHGGSPYRGSIRLVEPCSEITATCELTIEVSNHSDQPWTSEGPNPIYISYHWLDDDWNMVVWEGKRTALPLGGVKSGGASQIKVNIDKPSNTGRYNLVLTLVREGMSWFEGCEGFSPKIVNFEIDKIKETRERGPKVLFFLEPVVYNYSGFLSCHLFWAEMFAKATELGAGHFALAANGEVITSWVRSYSQLPNSEIFPIDSDAPLGPFNGNRKSYSQALYQKTFSENPLLGELKEIRHKYQPDIVIYTSQNSLAKTAFKGIASLHIEQAPLPRLGQPQRTSLDPAGHQVNSMLECYAERIRQIPLTQAQEYQLDSLLYRICIHLSTSLPESPAISEWIDNLKQSSLKIALLVTQPPEWVTYEGAFDSVDLSTLILNWAQDLPEGWVGIPTYHAGFRLNEECESELAKCSKVRILPREWSQGKTEALLPYVDGMVTLSSTVAMTAVLLQKKVAVTTSVRL